MRSRLVPPIVLLLLLVILQSKLADQKAANAKAVVNNERLASEVNDLKIGLEMVEERARQELGMVKPNEVFVQVTH